MTTVVGTGYTGARLLRRDAAIRGISRSIPDGLDAGRVALVDLDRSTENLSGDDTLIYTVPPGGPQGDERLAAFIARLASPPHRFVYLSTTGVYGDRGGDTVVESDPLKPESERAKRRVAAETLLGDWSEQHGIDLVILRVPGIYGPGRLMLDRVRSAEPIIAEAEASPGNRIHVDDLASACLLAADAGHPAGVYNLGDGDQRSSTWFVQEVARQLELPAVPEISRQEAEQTFSPRRLSFLRESRRIDTTRARQLLGFKPRYADATDGIRASLNES
ncbi:MAG: NAD-dependent epimerase/dehydratase family protein [Pseudomonadota bacterium]